MTQSSSLDVDRRGSQAVASATCTLRPIPRPVRDHALSLAPHGEGLDCKSCRAGADEGIEYDCGATRDVANGVSDERGDNRCE
jgi:hypothetical protein